MHKIDIGKKRRQKDILKRLDRKEVPLLNFGHHPSLGR